MASQPPMSGPNRREGAVLAHSPRVLSRILESIGEGVIVTDAAGTIDYVNAALEAMTGWTAPELIGRAIGEVFPMELETGVPLGHPVLQALQRVEVVQPNDAVMLPTRSGDRIPVDATSSPILDSERGGAVLGAVVALRDSRPRKGLEKAIRKVEGHLRDAQRLQVIGRLAGGIAHDFNNLLTIINGRSRLVLSRLEADDPIRQVVVEILNSGENAAELSDKLLAFGRQRVTAPERLDLNALVKRLEPTIEHLMGDDVDVRVTLSDVVPTAFADPRQLEQAIVNLALNARDAMPYGGSLGVETWLEPTNGGAGGDVLLMIRDNGVGMDPETRERAFEPFFTTKEIGEGRGLGLPVVQGIVEQSGGTVTVSSVPGKGTSVTIRLPRAVVPANSEKGQAPFVPQTALRGSGCVLVAEDQADVRKFVVDALAHFGYDVIEAGDAQEALDILSTGDRHVDVVLSDVVMPGRSGRELAKQVRRMRPGIGIVLMSGYPREDDPGSENFTFLQKPFGPEDLAREIRSAMAGNESRRILVVDDESDVRLFLRKVLEKAGYEVLEAADGNQAIRSVWANRVDLVIIDLVMPHQDGIGTIQTLRRNVPGIGIIVISGAFDGRYLKTAETLGADVALAKPFGEEEVLDVVSRVLRARGRHRASDEG